MNKTALLCLILAACSVSARSDNQTRFPANPDGFRDFVLDKTTAEEIINALGNPEKDKTAELEVSKLQKWLDAKHKEKIFRQLTYNNLGDFRKMEFSFLAEKLEMIDLEFKRVISPDKLKRIFGVHFEGLGGPVNLPDKPGEYPNIPFYPTHYPSYYSIIGISEKTFLLINCASSGGGTSPGRVERARQISRVLQKR